MMHTTRAALAAASIAVFLAPATASAQMAVALTGENTLVMVDMSKPAVVKSMAVDGAAMLVGIDVRPSNKMLYGVAPDGTVVTIDTTSGKATKVSKLEKTIAAGSGGIIDFNPAADKLRFMSTDGTNLRADVDTGKVTTDGSLAFETQEKGAPSKPNIVAAAYTNSFGKPEKTAMYDIDATLGALVHQTKPNDGTLKVIGSLGTGEASTFAFDVQTTAEGANTAWLVADNTLFKVALESGKVTKVGVIAGAKGKIRDLAVLQ